ncbi:MAG: phosphatidate cytidylyltransferase [Chlorobi bacterium]|nr:phosphatidate cytidylyltransferase [Chlorobiota bacterium]
MSNLAVRVLVALVGIPALVAIVLAGGWWLAGFVAISSGLGAGELYRMVQGKGIRPHTMLGIATATVIPLLVAAGYEHAVAPLVAALCILAMIGQLRRGTDGAISAIATTLLGAIYPAMLLASIVALRQWQASSTTDGAWLVLLTMSGIWMCDTAAYFVGRRFGQCLLAPRISPKKTWEGAIAGAFAGIAWCAVIAPLLLPWGSVWLGIGIGIVVGTVGQLGDLAESLLKRDAGIKDSSAIIPGHGGVLDRFDSLIATAPAVYGLLVILRWLALVP